MRQASQTSDQHEGRQSPNTFTAFLKLPDHPALRSARVQMILRDFGRDEVFNDVLRDALDKTMIGEICLRVAWQRRVPTVLSVVRGRSMRSIGANLNNVD